MEKSKATWDVIEKLQKEAIAWSLAVAAGNATLLLALGAFPPEDPMARAVLGAMALLAHGWGFWEMLRAWKALSACAQAEALMARVELSAWSRDSEAVLAAARRGHRAKQPR